MIGSRRNRTWGLMPSPIPLLDCPPQHRSIYIPHNFFILCLASQTVSVTYAGETEPPPGAGFDPFEREVHGPTVVLDDRASKIRVASNNSEFEDIDVWTCHFRYLRDPSPRKSTTTLKANVDEFVPLSSVVVHGHELPSTHQLCTSLLHR